MNHQMIVVKHQPLWMLLLRGSTRVCSGTRRVWGGRPLVWAVQAQEVPLPQSLHIESITQRSTKHWHVHILQVNTSFSNTKTPAGKERCHLEGAQWSYPLAPQESCRGVKSKVTINSAGIAWKHCAMDSFQPANILSWKGDCRDFLQTQTSPCTFYNQIPYLDLAQHKLA